MLPDFQIYYKAATIKTHGERDAEINRRESGNRLGTLANCFSTKVYTAVLMLGYGEGAKMAHCVLGQIPDPVCTSQEATSSRKAPAGSAGAMKGFSEKVLQQTDCPPPPAHTSPPPLSPSARCTSPPPSNPRRVPSFSDREDCLALSPLLCAHSGRVKVKS